MRNLAIVLMSFLAAGALGLALDTGATNAQGVPKGFKHVFDVQATTLASEYGFSGVSVRGGIEVWVSRSCVDQVSETLVKEAVNASLRRRAQKGASAGVPGVFRMLGTKLPNGGALVATVGIGGGVGGFSIQVFQASPGGVLQGPVVTDGCGTSYCGFQEAFMAYDQSNITALIVTSTDRFGMLQSSVVLRDGTRLGFAGGEIAEISTKDSASVIMLVSDIDKGMDVFRIIEVTDHIEDLVAPVRVRTLGDPRREPNLTEAEWKQRRDAMNAMRLKFQQIVLSRGARPPHMPVHVGDPEAEGSRPHPVPRSTAVPR